MNVGAAAAKTAAPAVTISVPLIVGAHAGRRPSPWRPPISPRLQAWRNATWKPAPSSRPSRRWRWCRRPSAAMPPSRRCRPRSTSPNRRRPSGQVTELEQKVTANPLDHQARFDLATALNASGNRAEATNQIAGDRASATANGMRMAHASSLLRSSRRGDRPTKRLSMDASGCRLFCFRKAGCGNTGLAHADQCRLSRPRRSS